MYVFGCGPLNYRTVLGPLPQWLCKTGTFFTVLCPMNLCLISLAITTTRFFFVCIYKSIPVMDDNFIRFSFQLIQNVVVVLATSAKFYLEEKATMTSVSQFSNQINDVTISNQIVRSLFALANSHQRT